ncbi:MAG: isochorismate synthase [candidate division Zixibacteria bacterium]|nr:isochorismate synthase [candidate division Zixibacteria bacterium]
MNPVKKGLAQLAEIIGAMEMMPGEVMPVIKRVSVEIDKIDPLDWLDHVRQSHKIYWRERDVDIEIAGAGAVVVYYADGHNRFQQVLSHFERYRLDNDHINFFGGFSFQPGSNKDNSTPGWNRYYDAYFFLPRFEISRHGDKIELAVNIMVHPSKPDEISNVLTQLHLFAAFAEPEARPSVNINSRGDIPGRDQWLRMLDSAANLIQNGAFEKIVLARQTHLGCDFPPSPWRLLKKLRKHSLNCYLLGFQSDESSVFISHTPERLYSRRGQKLQSEALAGTRPRGKTDQDDISLRNELLNSEKERREHRYVLDGILDNLAGLCETVNSDLNPSVLKLERVQHLYSKIEAVLNRGIKDSDLLAMLHPTPAVGGWPRDKALTGIKEIEPFARGWYAAPVGLLGSERAEFAVAIRSALIQESKMILFAGAGIVRDSEPEKEWNELENKISNYINLFPMTQL